MLSTAAIAVMVFSATEQAQPFKFDFGSGTVADGYTKITPTTKFSPALGYGIDSGTVAFVDRGGSDALRGDYLTTTDELFFSVIVPQGNYNVTVIFGDAEAATQTTVKVENRRLLFDRVQTVAGGFAEKSITVRRMEAKSIDGTVTMSLKDRERGYFTWDAPLTFRFTGKKPAVCGVEIRKADTCVTLFLCGNSTVVDQRDAPWCSWGQMLPCFFKPGVAVANHAESGLTAGNFLSMKRLAKILTEVKEGDYVFVEFGHNDQKVASEVTNYPANLKTFRDRIAAKKAIPVFVVPTARQTENDPLTSIGGLARTMRETAQSLGVVCIDLNQMVIDLKKALGSNTKYIYMYTENDQTHFCEYGAFELARCVMTGLEEKFPLLKSSFVSGYTTFNPSKPDPLDYMTIDLPTATGSHRAAFVRRNPEYSIKITGAALTVNGTLYGTAELMVFGIDGRLTGRELLPVKNTPHRTLPAIFEKLTGGTYIVYLQNRGRVSGKVVLHRW
jgi:lysophospholipase L1-like esterase